MDILIKNMKMPKGCTYEDNNGKPKICFMFNDCDLDRSRCPLVAVSNHRTCKDVTHISLKIIEKYCKGCDETEFIGKCAGCPVNGICKIIQDAPAIVEATE